MQVKQPLDGRLRRIIKEFVLKHFMLALLTAILFSCFNPSTENKSIELLFSHSMRIPYNTINIKINQKNNKYEINIITKQMNGKVGYEYSNTNKKIIVESIIIEEIFNDLLDINISHIKELNSNIHGRDGTSIILKYQYKKPNEIIEIWSIDYETDKRGLQELYNIIKKIIEISEIDPKLIL